LAPIILPHNKPISDFAFSPVVPSIMASCTRTDGVVRIWKIPRDLQSQPIMDQPQRDMEPSFYLSAHENEKKVELVRFHPTVGSILLSSAIDSKIKLWNIEEMKDIITMECTDSAIVQSVSFDYFGSTFAGTTSDGRLFVPRVSNL
jgi:WD40 repeat protein